MHPTSISEHVLIRQFDLVEYRQSLQAMRDFTANRNENTLDEIWFLSHYPVFTQGQAGKPEHILFPGNIPVVQSCRGGQVTYHGPGQLTVYFLTDLLRKSLSVRCFVQKLEDVIIELLNFYEISSHRKAGAPGVYVQDQKICSVGLRVRKGRCYHGIALNVNMDLSPFDQINPCGFHNLKMTQLASFVPNITLPDVVNALRNLLLPALGYDQRFVFEREETTCES